MLAAIISVVLVAAIFVFAVRVTPRILLYALVAAGMLIRFVAKKLFDAVPWIISAVVALTIGFVGLGRQFFGAGDAKLFVERFLPPREFERETFSLAVIELMIVTREKLFVNVATRR